jgi:hypothetical protein
VVPSSASRTRKAVTDVFDAAAKRQAADEDADADVETEPEVEEDD